MGERAQAQNDIFQECVAEFEAWVERVGDSQWQNRVLNDGRTVGVVAHHIANAFVGAAQGAFVLSMRRPISTTPASVDQGNARHAEQSAGVTKGDVLAHLRKNSAAAAAIILRLSDAQLAERGTVALYGGETLSAAEFAERSLIGHLQDHWANLRATLDQ